MTTALIDADIVAYRCASASEDEEEAIACFRIDDLMHNILLVQQVEKFSGYLTGKTNFRYSIYPGYKAHRSKQPKPKHLQACRDYLVLEWGCTITDGYEADDAIGIAAHNSADHIIVCSTDKDLLQIPGDNYNFVKDCNTYIGTLAADKHLYTQMLVGDTADNVIGVRGIGPVKAGKALDKGKTIADWFNIVRELYADDVRFLTNLNVFWILKNKDEIWQRVPEHQDLITPDLVPLAKELESKYSTSSLRPSLDNGMMESDGTLVSGTLTEVTV